jgi:hypothetical protein
MGVPIDFFDIINKRIYYFGSETDLEKIETIKKEFYSQLQKHCFDNSIKLDYDDVYFVRNDENWEHYELELLNEELNEHFKIIFDELPISAIYPLIENYDSYISLADDGWVFILYYSGLQESGKQILISELNKYLEHSHLKPDDRQIEICRDMQKKRRRTTPICQSIIDSERAKLLEQLNQLFNSSSFPKMEYFVDRMPHITNMEHEDWELLIRFFKLGRRSRAILVEAADRLISNPDYRLPEIEITT